MNKKASELLDEMYKEAKCNCKRQKPNLEEIKKMKEAKKAYKSGKISPEEYIRIGEKSGEKINKKASSTLDYMYKESAMEVPSPEEKKTMNVPEKYVDVAVQDQGEGKTSKEDARKILKYLGYDGSRRSKI